MFDAKITATIKPCPFCGGKAYVGVYDYEAYGESVCVRCSGCHVETFEYDTVENAIEAWNSRAENEELKFTREFIHEHGLEFALADAWRRAHHEH